MGRRAVNIFEVGEPPKDYPLDTPHFEEVTIEFDPFMENPIEIVRERLERVRPEARVILTIRGYIDSKKIKKNESEVAERVREIVKEIIKKEPVEERLEFRDMYTLLEDDLYKSFINKLEQTGYDEGRRKRLRELVIRAMMEIKMRGGRR